MIAERMLATGKVHLLENRKKEDGKEFFRNMIK